MPNLVNVSLPDFKNDSYKILKKLRELEKSKTKVRVVTKTDTETSQILLVLLMDRLQNVYSAALAALTAVEAQAALQNFIQKFVTFKEQVDSVCLTEGKVLADQSLTTVLSSHTDTFNTIIRFHPQMMIDRTEWDEAQLLAITIWNNTIRFRS